jgi:hypothetical protein
VCSSKLYISERRKGKDFVMKKMIIFLAVLALVVPAMAGVEITCEKSGTTFTVSYTASDDANKPRAFALDLVVDNGATIVDVNDFNADFWVYPGSIQINNGAVADYGDAVADPCDYPTDTKLGRGKSGATVEMGSLYETTAPGNTGVLFTVDVSADCNLTITENNARGGVVIEDVVANETFNPTISACQDAAPAGCPGDVDSDDDLDLDDYNTIKGKLAYAKYLTGTYRVIKGNATTGFLWPCP